ncbi:hypothetical protein Syun_021384 [Stephania yunnanensis]|uniref:Uncharacterized protein n=1 Tax=Stephania yunnanensis TaxID=152371 RepID=A0AAP0IHI0_9MAGN
MADARAPAPARAAALTEARGDARVRAQTEESRERGQRSMYNKKNKQKSGKEGDSSSSMTSGFVDSNGKFMDIKKLLRDVQFLGK